MRTAIPSSGPAGTDEFVPANVAPRTRALAPRLSPAVAAIGRLARVTMPFWLGCDCRSQAIARVLPMKKPPVQPRGRPNYRQGVRVGLPLRERKRRPAEQQPRR
jgi:hypothetical protein